MCACVLPAGRSAGSSQSRRWCRCLLLWGWFPDHQLLCTEGKRSDLSQACWSGQWRPAAGSHEHVHLSAHTSTCKIKNACAWQLIQYMAYPKGTSLDLNLKHKNVWSCLCYPEEFDLVFLKNYLTCHNRNSHNTYGLGLGLGLHLKNSILKGKTLSWCGDPLSSPPTIWPPTPPGVIHFQSGETHACLMWWSPEGFRNLLLNLV